MFKYLLAGLLLFPIGAESQTKKSDIDRAKLAAMGFSPMPVGSIVQSLLTEAQFQGENGVGWVLMTGQAIAGSKLCTKHSLCSLPDARGQFLRTAGGSAAALRALQGQATAKNGLSNSASAVTGTTNIGHNHGASSVSGTTNIAHGHSASSDLNGGHSHSITDGGLFFATNAGVRYASAATAGELDYTLAGAALGVSTAPNHNHTINVNSLGTTNVSLASGSAAGQSLGTTNVSLASGSAAAQTISGDTETRPVNLTVNTFIKIN